MEQNLNNIIRRQNPDGLNHNLIRGLILHDIFAEPAGLVEIKVFDLENMENDLVESYFRFKKEDIPRLAKMLRIPDIIKTRSGFTASGVEGLCILLKRLSYPNRLCDLKIVFKKSSAALSEIINYVNAHIARTFGHLIENLESLHWLNKQRLQLYANVIAARGAAVQNCWAFIDGTTRAICRPSENQENYYSGHKRYHCLKYQSLLTPDGMIVSALGAFPGRRHDAFIFGESGLYEQLQEKTRFDDGHYVIYGDQAYGIRQLLLTPYPEQRLNQERQNFNRSMSIVRQAVEWGFQKIISLFAFVDFKKNQKLLLQDIELMYKTAVILTNCHTCLYSSETSHFFNMPPITLEEYLM